MGKAKDIILRPISAQRANELVRRVHYSGKVVNNSQVHVGVFWNGKLEGAFQFGPSLDKRKIAGLVSGTKWHEFIELNRLAFTDELPRNSESRAISICMKILRKHSPQLKWVVSFADATQCGDGTIYRASGFVLTGIKKNSDLIKIPGGAVTHSFNMKASIPGGTYHGLVRQGESFRSTCERIGAKPLDGFQLRYIYFLGPSYRSRLTVPEIPFSRIKEMGASMHKGQKLSGSGDLADTPGVHPGKGGSIPTLPLQVS